MLIGEFADRTGLSQRTVRHYDEIKVLQASGRSECGYRFYAPADLDRARVIRAMRALSLSTTEIRNVLATLDRIDSASYAPTPADRRELEVMLADAECREHALRQRIGVASDFVEMLSGL
ncbi:MerR family transcriptional regulator [Cryobacterium sp. TMT2-18-3]|uniref:helix-turn-helix domain-containing protein n=1 Tax=unclassified Cryobacterium TaxID=2649013 RepID=UPI00106CF69C|nr:MULTISPECIES: MerR family transcriptional regulator [unclassified Cryobacterium]TFC30278.1 MerR family transcriptional regulator [Cryobacterium sp. TMT2-18-2]TFC35117.1 MerR family transcriptional regulator [Cryobacterium sp. TMT2-42-4]TFC63584.1 MerR family transcriptional regulator [Cryobacterium sp. TMT2-18-3]